MSPLYCRLTEDNTILIQTANAVDNLTIAFHRTVRVPDISEPCRLPGSLGHFPLSSVESYKDSLPANMVAKGGVFFPMYQSEAMWVRFTSKSHFVIKMYVGGINVVSGEKAKDDMDSNVRRAKTLADGRSLQDYLAIPAQRWLDGIASSVGQVRQFVAMPFGSGYSVEAQLTGRDTVGGLQFDIWRRVKWPEEPTSLPADILIKVGAPLTKRWSELAVNRYWHTHTLKQAIQTEMRVPPDQQTLVLNGRRLEDGRPLDDYDIANGSCVHIVLRVRGGGGVRPDREEMSFAAGGKIWQNIVKDDRSPSSWRTREYGTLNVQVLNSQMYRHVTGKDPPHNPPSAQTYSKLGLPFFKLYEEPSDVSGDFAGVDSIATIDQTKNKGNGDLSGMDSEERIDPRIVVLNPQGPLAPFTPVSILEEKVRKLNLASQSD